MSKNRADLLAGAGFLLGAGLGGFMDGIFFHQILQWHHMLSAVIPPDNLVNVKVNMFWDGIFHAAVWTMTCGGLGLLWASGKCPETPARGRILAGTMLAGWGAFNLVEGLIDHQWLGLHHVNDIGGPTLAWDMGFLAFGASLLLAGIFLTRAGRGPLPDLSNLEPEARALALATARPPYLFQLGPEKGRLELDKVQSSPSPVPVPDTLFEDLGIPGGPFGTISIRIVRPRDAEGPLPVILYAHGAGWVFGNSHTHDRLIRELSAGAGAALVFVNYSLSPEAKYPVAIEEIYATAQWISGQGAAHGLDPDRLCVAGDSVGGNMAAVVSLMAKKRGGPKISLQLLFYPVTDASFDTASYRRYARGWFLRRDAMQWFWKQYLSDPAQGAEVTASPLRAGLEEMKGLPPALIITGEADVLRDEGEAYGEKLRAAGVRVTSVRFQGMVHDFMMLNCLSGTAATRGAMALAVDWLKKSWISVP